MKLAYLWILNYFNIINTLLLFIDVFLNIEF